MSTMDNEKSPAKPLNRNRIARAIFAAAESMGIRDRELVERLTTRVIERFEKPQGKIQHRKAVAIRTLR